ncbi:MAG TPA: hypothetical protein VM580_08390 [Labilithrix sp.]|nr:hypothetical protein [Labilithrix sp.]
MFPSKREERKPKHPRSPVATPRSVDVPDRESRALPFDPILEKKPVDESVDFDTERNGRDSSKANEAKDTGPSNARPAKT